MGEALATDIIFPPRAFVDAAPQLAQLSRGIDRAVLPIVEERTVFGLMGQDVVKIDRSLAANDPGAVRYELTVHRGAYPRDARDMQEYVRLAWWADPAGSVNPPGIWLTEQSKSGGRISLPDPERVLPELLGSFRLDDVQWFDPDTQRVKAVAGEARVVPRNRLWLAARRAGSAALRPWLIR
jgi:hypothetical protein